MKMSIHLPLPTSLITAALLAATGAPMAPAQSVWTGGTSTWNTAGNWSPSGVPSSSSATFLEFTHTGSTYTSTDNLTGDFTLNKLRISGSSAGTINVLASSNQRLVFTADGDTLPVILFDSTSSAAKVFNLPLVFNADTTISSSSGVNSTGNLQLGTLSGSGKLIVDFTTTGSGTVLLQLASASYTGGIDIRSGRVAVGNANAIGSGALTLSGGILRTTNSAGTLTFANAVNIGGNATVFESANANGLTFTGGGSIQGTNATRTITLGNAGATLTLAGGYTGTGNGLTFAGSGTAALGNGSSDTAANTYSGATTVSSATTTLKLDKAAGTNAVAGNLAASAGNIFWERSNQVADTATITLTGTGKVSLFNAAATTGAVETIAALSITNGTLAFANNSLLAVTGGVTLGAGANLDITHFNPTSGLAGGTTFILIDTATSISGTFVGYSEGYTFDLNGNTFETSYLLGASHSDFGFVVAAIPEPSTFAGIAGLLALGATAVNRRRIRCSR
ncbi:MAG TPA: PEP-CTERM sorting domain-containing protein [Rariglobus sp.]